MIRNISLVFRGSAGSTYGKEMRWSAETNIQPELTGKVFSRNQLMNDNAEWYLDRSEETTDILHEYFVDREHGVATMQYSLESIALAYQNLNFRRGLAQF
jgi:hypothetical protein